MAEDRPLDYPAPTRFVLGTIGMPGSREFYLQADGPLAPRGEHRTTTVALEKQQAAALADRVEQVLDGRGHEVPEFATDNDPLSAGFTSPDAQVGTMSIRWDGQAERLVLEFFDVNDDDGGEDVPRLPPMLRVTLTADQAAQFVARSIRVIAAGRPPCPFCSEPLDPDGHICPRANGYRR